MKKVHFQIEHSLFNKFSLATAIGLLTIIIGFFATERVWPNILLASYYITGIGFCGMMFVAIQYVSNAGWAVVIRRIPEAMFSSLLIGFLLMVPVAIGAHSLYEWTHTEVVANDPILLGKEPWLNLNSFMIRIPIYYGIWYFLGRPIVNHSRRQDETGKISHTRKAVRWSAAWLYIGGIAYIISSFDWIMSLEPHWFSTIFGLYNFSGMFTAGLSFMIIVLIYLRRSGYRHRWPDSGNCGQQVTRTGY